ncbi:hypothetical protein EDD18DRAFT_1189046 [Armillaria luteobubalina]|uniref:Uncharacterized protein n=1 Tax=Armillaria luteobubalina TaxID=153913 RepID=A0AA39PSF8_9AGAR|nr:hypothetical protein EDD18DRAFT_1189046 [Armillaria luteobubalina]
MCHLAVLEIFTSDVAIVSTSLKTLSNEETHCKFSLFHPASCRPPVCQRTCWQYLHYPEQYSPHICGYCPSCTIVMSYHGGQ